MTEPKPKRAKRVKPDPELVELADSLLTIKGQIYF